MLNNQASAIGSQQSNYPLRGASDFAARLTEHSIKKVEVLEYEDLGVETVWKIEVEDFPVFIVINHEGKDFYADLATQ